MPGPVDGRSEAGRRGGERILAIDPGTQVVGYAVVERPAVGQRRHRGPGGAVPMAIRASNVVRSNGAGASGASVLCVDTLRLGRNRGLPERLACLQAGVEQWIQAYEPSVLAIEEAFSGRSIQSALRIGEARGVVLGLAGRFGLEVREFAPARIKRAVTGSGRADKEQVARMVCQAFAIPRPPSPSDATDALAVALCCLEAERAQAFRGNA